MQDLAGRIAFVTGASKGIGAGIARCLAGAGATVIANYATSQVPAEALVAGIVAEGGKASAIQGDFSRPDDITRVYAQIRERHGRIDVLVNNAGLYAFGPIESVTAETFHRQFDLNVLGLLLSTQAAVPLFGPDGGSIINIGSAVASMAPSHSAIYSATKGAVDSITVALSKELGPRGIRVNSLNPGMIATEGAVESGILEGPFRDRMLKTTPLGRLGLPDDVADVALFLASDRSRWVSGQRIIVAGGQTM